MQLMLWAAVLSTLATAGLGLLLVRILFWGGVAYGAFYAVDRRKHIQRLV